MRKIEKDIKANCIRLTGIIDPDAKHNEEAWRKYFPNFYEWAIPGKEQ
jgi:hypothetical protein